MERKKKILFFDVDGTLIDIATHKVPGSAIDAIAQAHDNGHKIVIATGRSHTIANIPPLYEMGLIDGIVSLNGAVCMIGGEVISSTPIPRGELLNMIELCRKRGYTIIFVTMDGMKVAQPDPRFPIDFEQHFGLTPVPRIMLEDAETMTVFQMTVFFNEETETEIRPLMPGCEFNRWYPSFVDITAKGCDKAFGVGVMTSRFGIPIEDTIAFGDGGNDIPMIRRAGTGVAMGNATDDVKRNADYVTSSVDADGIAKAISKLLML